MLGRLTAAFLMMALIASGLVAQPGTKDKKGKDEPKGLVGKVVSVDAAKNTVTVSVAGKNQTFSVTDKTQIVGPLGGVSKDRLKDDRLLKGIEITVYPGKDPKVADKLKLGYRAPATKDAPKKDKKG